MGTKPLRLAVDTNVLLDLVEPVEAVIDAFEVLDRRLPDHDRLVGPSVLDELAFLCDFADTEPVRQSALSALKSLRKPGRFRVLLELAYPQGLIEEVARRVRSRDLLPTEEAHDSLIWPKPLCWGVACC